MFSKKWSSKRKRTKEDGAERYKFLKQLVEEYGTTRNIDHKKQVLANLANFGYDPTNYEHFKELHIVDLFLNELTGDDEQFISIVLAGLCNIVTEEEFLHYIVKLNGIKLVSESIYSKNIEAQLNVITILFYLLNDENKVKFNESGILGKLEELKNSDDMRIKNLTIILLQKYYS